MPEAWETRIVDGEVEVWVPKTRPITTTNAINRGGFEVDGMSKETIVEVNGRGKIRELTIAAENEIHFMPVIDGIDLLNGHNTFAEISSIYDSDLISARYDNLRYIINLNGIHFSNSIRCDIWFTERTVVESIFGAYDLYGVQ
jgi:hypothetical protein